MGPGDSHLDLFVTDPYGAVYSNWWESGPGWQKWFSIHPEATICAGAPVSALWRPGDSHLDLFVTDPNGAVYSNWWEPGPGWQKWFSIDPEVTICAGAPVSALWRPDSHLDLFVTDPDGAVYSNWWEPGPGWQKWFSIDPEVTICAGATVSALWRPGTLI